MEKILFNLNYKKLKKEMKIAAQTLNFEKAAMIRDQIKFLNAK